MADNFIRQLTHDNDEFESNWSEIYDKIHRYFNESEENEDSMNELKIRVLDAVVDYVLVEANPEVVEPTYTKFIFVAQIVKLCSPNAIKRLKETTDTFQRILHQDNLVSSWFLNAIEKIYFDYRLFNLLVQSEFYDSIESILRCFQKQSFLNDEMNEKSIEDWQRFFSQRLFSPISSDTNKLNDEKTMAAKRSAFQDIFRHAVKFSKRSNVWNSVVSCLNRTLPNLFDIYEDPSHVQIDMKHCVEEPVSTDYVFLLSKSYQKNPIFIQSNLLDALTMLEKLLLGNYLREASYFLDLAILDFLNKAVDVGPLVVMLTRVALSILVENRALMCKEIFDKVTYKLGREKCPKQYSKEIFEFSVVLLGLMTERAPHCVQYILEKNDFYPWKELASRTTELVRLCSAYENVEKSPGLGELDHLVNVLQILSQRAKACSSIYPATHEQALSCILRWAQMRNVDQKLKPWPSHVYRMGQQMFDLIDRRKINDDVCTKFLEAIETKSIEDEIMDEDQSVNVIRSSLLTILSSRLMDYIDHLKGLSLENHRKLANILVKALSCSMWFDSGEASFEQSFIDIVWNRIVPHLTNETIIRLYEPCIKQMRILAYEHDQKKFQNWCTTFWSHVSFKAPEISANYIDEFFQDVFESRILSNATWLPGLYLKRPESFHSRLDTIIDELLCDDISYNCSLAQIFHSISRENPDLFQAKHIEKIFDILKTRQSTSIDLFFLFLGLGFIASSQPSLVEPHESELIGYVLNFQHIAVVQCLQNYFAATAIVHGEAKAKDCLTLIIDLLKNSNINTEIRAQLYRACQLIGLVHKSALESKRAELLKFNTDSDCRLLIDFIDGNKLSEEYQKTISATRDEVMILKKRFVKTEQNLEQVTDTVKQQTTKIDALDTHVTEVKNQVEDLSEKVTAQAAEIERIDAKTLSYVPSSWGSDVCKLLNKRADNDWRLLGKRFGYSTSELRHWSLQSDPTMSVLNEWFMTHKTDEATYGLIKVLEEINRKDVVQIIREAVKAAGELIPDDMDVEIKRLPPVFLSYQWGIQKAVLRLKMHLEEAGYLCWMDTGQMGGGDKLFNKIDAGIRGAKVIICCMNKAYANSDNCSREVHLSVSTGKQLIPLQMEKQTWPPEGALGPIMSEYLFIRFFDRKNSDPDYWPADKFTELLGQIRYHVAPDPDMITNRYHNWFIPRPDNLIFLQPTSDSQNQVADNTPLVVTHPQIMISYQWDRQKDIVKLYERLTNLGYRCWLDIFQMGGGDSLFEKIDHGIRNAKCILACVTPKYIMSINCRREMSLGDSLKKLILPLYLDETSSWPPPGPMAMVFAGRPYIDFRQANGDIWTSKGFDEVLARLKIAIPDVNVEQPERHLIEMKRPVTASIKENSTARKSERVQSAPSKSGSRACLLM